MATYLDGNVRRATANTVTAMKNSAVSRQCPKCGRKSAVKRYTDYPWVTIYCRWVNEGKCDHLCTYSLDPADNCPRPGQGGGS